MYFKTNALTCVKFVTNLLRVNNERFIENIVQQLCHISFITKATYILV